MTAIGFHVGPIAKMNGLGDNAITGQPGWMSILNDFGVPFCLKSTDHFGPIFEAAQVTRRTNVDNQLIFRMTAKVGDYWLDVPDYSLQPAAAAQKHWEKMSLRIPPEYWQYRDLVWFEVINEVDKNRSVWLGQFLVELGKITFANGMKMLAPGWSSGEPEPEHWAGMHPYLQLCSDKPEWFGVALHEYSFDKNDILRQFPYLVGRFQQLHDYCNQNDLRWPVIHMTEWGWGRDGNSVPEPAQAMDDIKEVWGFYAGYRNIKSMAIWALNNEAEWASLGDKVHRYMEPVKNWLVTKPPLPPEIKQPPSGPPVIEAPLRLPYAIVTHLLPQHWADTGAWYQIAEKFAASRNTYTFSADHAAISCLMGRKEGSKIIIWNANEIGTGLTDQWFVDNGYRDVVTEYRLIENINA